MSPPASATAAVSPAVTEMRRSPRRTSRQAPASTTSTASTAAVTARPGRRMAMPHTAMSAARPTAGAGQGTRSGPAGHSARPRISDPAHTARVTASVPGTAAQDRSSARSVAPQRPRMRRARSRASPWWVVAWNESEEVARSLPAVAGQLREDDELIVVDNGSRTGRRMSWRAAPGARLQPTGANRGFMAAVNCRRGGAHGRPAGPPEPRRGGGRGLARGDRAPVGRGLRLVGLAGAGDLRRAGASSTPPATSCTSRASAGQAGRPAEEAPTRRARCPTRRAPAWVPLATRRSLDGFPEYSFLHGIDADLRLGPAAARRAGGIEPAVGLRQAYEFFGAAQVAASWSARAGRSSCAPT